VVVCVVELVGTRKASAVGSVEAAQVRAHEPRLPVAFLLDPSEARDRVATVAGIRERSFASATIVRSMDANAGLSFVRHPSLSGVEIRVVRDRGTRSAPTPPMIGLPDQKLLGVPAVELDVEQFILPLKNYTTSYFLTARLAARRMVPNKSGVIMTVSALHSRKGIPFVGRLRSGAGCEGGAHSTSVRRARAPRHSRGRSAPQAMLETRTIKNAYEPRAKATGMKWEEWQQLLASRTHGRRLMTLEEMANVAAFVASDKASGMTGTTVNLTMGSLDD